MSYLSIIFIAIGLSMDAFAVSITSGVTLKTMRIKHAMLIAGFFGVFQALMPVMGWLTGGLARGFVETLDHWVAMILLSVIGIKMIYEALTRKEDEPPVDPLNLYVLFALAVATSIDAFVIGVILSFLKVAILLPVLIIGLITFSFSFVGAYIGSAIGHLFENKIEILGGLVLIGMGVKILVEHLFFPV